MEWLSHECADCLYHLNIHKIVPTHYIKIKKVSKIDIPQNISNKFQYIYIYIIYIYIYVSCIYTHIHVYICIQDISQMYKINAKHQAAFGAAPGTRAALGLGPSRLPLGILHLSCASFMQGSPAAPKSMWIQKKKIKTISHYFFDFFFVFFDFFVHFFLLKS